MLQLPPPPIFADDPDPIPIDAKHFPDEVFREWISSNVDDDNDDYLDAEEIDNLTYLDINYVDVTDFTGLELFTNIDHLQISMNKAVSTLNISNLPTVSQLYINNCEKLTDLSIQNNPNLKKAQIFGLEQLANLDIQESSLQELDISDNPLLSSIDLRGCPNILNLKISYMPMIQSLNLNQNTQLQRLEIINTALSYLDLSKNTELSYVMVTENRLTSLNLNGNKHLDDEDFIAYAQANTHPIRVGNLSRTFDLSTLPDGFELDRATGWYGGDLDGHMLRINEDGEDAGYAIYDYQLVNDDIEHSGTIVGTEFFLILNWFPEKRIHFDAGEGSGTMEPVIVPEEEPYVFPASAFTAPAGQVFKGWSYEQNVYQPGETMSLENIDGDDLTLTAVWQPAPIVPPGEIVQPGEIIPYDIAEICFYPNGGQWVDGSTAPIVFQVKIGDTISIPDGPVRPGYIFSYWQGSKYYPGDSYTVEGDHDFIARYLEDVGANTQEALPQSAEAPAKSSSDAPPVDLVRNLPNTGETAAYAWVSASVALGALGLLLIIKKNSAKQRRQQRNALGLKPVLLPIGDCV